MRTWIVTLLLGAYFIAAGSLFVPRLGFQPDEVLFAGGIYEPQTYEYGVTIGEKKYPLMLMTYLGATKSLFYRRVFKHFGTSEWSVRGPMLLVGVAAIGLTFALLAGWASPGVALFGAALLATDGFFLLMTIWGPANLHNVLLLGIFFGGWRFHATGSRWALALAAFSGGLALWDKALFLWLLGGIAVALIAVFPRETWRAATLRNAAVVVLAFAIGAGPVIAYNVSKSGRTLTDNTSLQLDDFRGKSRLLYLCLVGRALFGWMIEDGESLIEPKTAVERASVALSQATSTPRTSGQALALAASVLLLPLWWRSRARRPLLFLFVTMLVAWLQMAITRNAGGAAHHAVLLWPMPHMAIALAFGAAFERISARWLTAVAGVALCASNIAVTNQYFRQLVTNGAGLNFSTAVNPMVRYLETLPESNLMALDWGIVERVRILGRGKLLVRLGDIAFSEMSPMQEATAADWAGKPDFLFLAHAEGREFFPGTSARMTAAVAKAGYKKELLRTFADPHGRPTFEVFRYTR